MQLLIKPDGDVRCLYDETLDLQGLGRLHIERGSHVEPDADGLWTADLSPVAGPLLGPFPVVPQHWPQNTTGSINTG